MTNAMSTRPLLISAILNRASTSFGDVEIVSRLADDSLFRYSYRDLRRRACQLANAFTEHGVVRGERVATLAWNDHRHIEIQFAVSGIGAVVHPCDPKLNSSQLARVLNLANDTILMFEPSFLSVVEEASGRCVYVKTYVALCDEKDMPKTHRLPNLICYESRLKKSKDEFVWPELGENDASALCFTSSTTVSPKEKLHTHKSSVLRALALGMPNSLSLSTQDCVLPVVAMFRGNGWGIPYAAAMNGAKLVLPGKKLDPESLYGLMEKENVTCSAGIPAMWTQLAQFMGKNNLTLTSMRSPLVGGAVVPRALIRGYADKFNIKMQHAIGLDSPGPLKVNDIH